MQFAQDEVVATVFTNQDDKPQVVLVKILEKYQDSAKVMQMNFEQRLQIVPYTQLFKMVQQDEELEVGQKIYCLWYDFLEECVWIEFKLAKVVETYPDSLIVKIEFYSDRQNYVQVYKQYCVTDVDEINKIIDEILSQQQNQQNEE